MPLASRRDSLRYFAWPAYATAAVIVLAAGIDLAQTLWPFAPMDPAWRYGAAGFLSGSLVTPSLAALLALGTALYFEHVRVQLALAAAAALACLLFVAAGISFTLDALVVGSQTQPNAQDTLLIAQAKALIKLGLGFILTWLYAVAAYRSARDLRQADRRARASSEMVVSASGKAGAS